LLWFLQRDRMSRNNWSLIQRRIRIHYKASLLSKISTYSYWVDPLSWSYSENVYTIQRETVWACTHQIHWQWKLKFFVRGSRYLLWGITSHGTIYLYHGQWNRKIIQSYDERQASRQSLLHLVFPKWIYTQDILI
jgi:hypothetical protein